MAAPPQMGVFNTPIDDVEVVTILITPTLFKTLDNTLATAIPLIKGKPGTMIEVFQASANMQFPKTGGVPYASGTGSIFGGFSNGSIIVTNVGFGTSPQIKGGNSYYQLYQPSNINYPSTYFGSDFLLTQSAATLYTAGNSPFLYTIRYRYINVA